MLKLKIFALLLFEQSGYLLSYRAMLSLMSANETITEDQIMRRALASVIIVAFAGLLLTSLIAVFSGSHLGGRYVNSHSYAYPYFMAY